MSPFIHFLIARLHWSLFFAGIVLGLASPWKAAAFFLIAISCFLPSWRSSWPAARLLTARAARRIQSAGEHWRRGRFRRSRIWAAPSWLAVAWVVAVWWSIVSCLIALAGKRGPNDPLFNFSIRLLLGVAIVDASRLGWRALQWAWTNPLGKVCLAFAGALVGSVAVSLARHILFGLTHEDPGKSPASMALFSALMVPRAWVEALSIAGVVAFIPVAAVSVWSFFNGRAQRRQTRPPFHTLRVWIRPTLICLAPMAATEMFPGFSPATSSWFHAHAAALVAQMDYLEDTACGLPVRGANRVDDHRVSIARADGQGVILTTIPCDRSAAERAASVATASK